MHSVRVFASTNTPIVTIPGRGLIVGDLFTKDGRPVTGTLPTGAASGELENHLLNHYWGEYIAIELSEDNSPVCRIMRDPSGGVRCVYSFDGEGGFITSDISAAIELGLYRKTIDWDSISHWLLFSYLRTGRTALRDLHELLPGCSLSIGVSRTEVRPAWSPWTFVSNSARTSTPREAIDEVRSAVSLAVGALAGVEDRIILELSGGLDSSIVAACLGSRNSRVRYCNMVVEDGGTDERQYAELMTARLDVDLNIVDVRFGDVRFDYPTPRWSVIPSIGALQNGINDLWENAAKAHDATSFFSGAGGDTVFCYLKTAAPAADALKERGLVTGINAVRNLSSLHQCTFWKAGRLTLRKLLRRKNAGWKSDRSFLSASALAISLQPHPWLPAPPDVLPGDREKIFDLMGNQLFRDSTPRGEGRSMRFPLLSQPVVEACLRVPTWMWIDEGRNRSIARDAFSDLLPDRILNRRSKESHLNYMAAVYTRSKPEIRNILGCGHLRSQGIVDWEALETFFESGLVARDMSFLRVIDLCMVENWLRDQLPV
ncbi:asparagine synthase-related protein [Luteimonas sp. BDR2-5]|uniref:asparagine synthase-related protein n=1 Tax=Proluteimonas luteida TaxID=2878685 RepID=UPI001E4E47E0|nr:asparagine synthase C-terminal domain-containing protein [Luteimonas sp. BDR2-5]